nr:hypothetical protein CFP56_33965 [Quercus suber]
MAKEAAEASEQASYDGGVQETEGGSRPEDKDKGKEVKALPKAKGPKATLKLKDATSKAKDAIPKAKEVDPQSEEADPMAPNPFVS